MTLIHVSFVAACTALIAGIAGPLTTLAISRRQYNATVLANSRERWTATLRDGIAELVSLLAAVAVVKANWKGAWNSGHGALAANADLLPKFERIVLLRWNIRLLTSSKEPTHIELWRAIDTAIARLQSDDASHVIAEADIETIAQASQVILSATWHRLKRGT